MAKTQDTESDPDLIRDYDAGELFRGYTPDDLRSIVGEARNRMAVRRREHDQMTLASGGHVSRSEILDDLIREAQAVAARWSSFGPPEVRTRWVRLLHEDLLGEDS